MSPARRLDRMCEPTRPVEPMTAADMVIEYSGMEVVRISSARGLDGGSKMPG